MNLKYFLTLPVYKLPQEKYETERQKYITENTKIHASLPQLADQLIIAKEYYLKQFGGSWEFNEIIGFIKLHQLGSQIRGEYTQSE